MMPILLVVSWIGEINISLSAFAPHNLISQDGFGSLVLCQPTHLHTQAESGAYLRDSSRVPRQRPFICVKPPYAIGSVLSLSGHAIAYRERSLPRVRGYRASKPQGSSERVLPWQVTMDQLICASLSHTHYWYKVGLLKVPYMLSIQGKNRPCPARDGRVQTPFVQQPIDEWKDRSLNRTNRDQRNYWFYFTGLAYLTIK